MIKKGRDFRLPCFIIPVKLRTWKRKTEYDSELVEGGKERQ